MHQTHFVYLCYAVEISLVLPRTECFPGTFEFLTYLVPFFLSSKNFVAKFKAAAS